jgi:hypothetical protein
VTLHAIDTLVTEFRPIGVEAVITVFRVPDDMAVGAVFVPDIAEDKITIVAPE